MCYKTNRILVLISLVIGCCGLGVALYIFTDGYYLPYKPCRPITYPEGQTITSSFSQNTTDSVTAVLQFYDEQLTVQPFPGDVGQWRREELADSKYLYSCYAVDSNRITTETGCINVESDGISTHIEAKLLRAEGANDPCPK